MKERQRVAKHARKNENCRRCAYLASMFRMPWQENLFTLTHTDTCSQSRYMCAAHTHTHTHFTAAARIYWLPLIHLNGAIKLIKPKHSRCCSCRAAFLLLLLFIMLLLLLFCSFYRVNRAEILLMAICALRSCEIIHCILFQRTLFKANAISICLFTYLHLSGYSKKKYTILQNFTIHKKESVLFVK